MYIGYFQYSLVLILIAFLGVDKAGLDRNYKIVTGTTLLLLGFYNFSNNSILEYLLGIFGQLSISTTLLLIALVISNFSSFSLVNSRDKKSLLFLVVAIGVVFYPMTLGLTLTDPYRFGFQPNLLASVFLMAAILIWFLGYRFLAVCILAASISHEIGLLESDNYWDNLFDIYLFIYGMIYFVVAIFRKKIILHPFRKIDQNGK